MNTNNIFGPLLFISIQRGPISCLTHQTLHQPYGCQERKWNVHMVICKRLRSLSSLKLCTRQSRLIMAICKKIHYFSHSIDKSRVTDYHSQADKGTQGRGSWSVGCWGCFHTDKTWQHRITPANGETHGERHRICSDLRSQSLWGIQITGGVVEKQRLLSLSQCHQRPNEDTCCLWLTGELLFPEDDVWVRSHTRKTSPWWPLLQWRHAAPRECTLYFEYLCLSTPPHNCLQ